MSTTPENPAPAPAPAAAGSDNTVAILSYITLIGFIVAIIMHSSKKTELGACHLRQCLGLYVTGVVLWFPCIIISLIPFVNFLMLLIWPLLGISLFVLWLMGLIGAASGQKKLMPVVGEHYQKWFANAFA